MADYIDTWYARTRATADQWPQLTGSVRADVCVIGGGLAGLTTALELVERGRSVALVEANRIGWGASGRNGGFVSAGYACSMDQVVRKVGLDHARALYALSLDAVRTVRERIERFAIPCGPVTPGLVKAALAQDDPDLMQRTRETLFQRFGVERHYWSAAEVQERFATRRYGAALLDSAAFHQHSLNYARGVAEAARAAGALLYEDSPAQAVEGVGAGHRVRTARGEVLAQHVVFCASGYLGWLNPRLASAIVPVATYVMVTPPLGERLGTVIRVPHGVSDTRFCNDYYRPLADTRLMWGGRVSTAEPSAERIGAMLRRDMLAVYPQLHDVPVEVAWGGRMGYARHKMPQIGTLGRGVWYATAFGGHGMAQTGVGGRLIAAAIAEGDDRYRLFDPWGLQFTGGSLAKPVAQAIYWGHKLRDAWRARQGPARTTGTA
ncbi:MAG: FAD-binding oxidoreductase [Alphaproteobacteria bacterium]|nr:MAG: FAD-binding oxidoreductase [Alphaproteobacteria bacterium]